MSDRFIVNFGDLTIVRAKTTNGGKGSGFHGHYGRPGEIGGSSAKRLNFAQSVKDWIEDLDTEYNGEFSEDLDKIQQEFNEMGLELGKIKVTADYNEIPESWRAEMSGQLDGQAFVRKNGQGILYVSGKTLSDYGMGVDYKYKEGEPIGEQTTYTTSLPLGTLRHELGHFVHDMIYVKSRLKKITTGRVKGTQKESFCRQLVEKALGTKVGAGNYHPKMSFYSAENWGEFIAESFANPKYSTDTKKVYDYCVGELKRLTSKNAVDKEEDEWQKLCVGYIRENDKQEKTINGGKGSGFHGHYGRPGLVGGSSADCVTLNYDELLAANGAPGTGQKIATDLSYKLIDEIERKHPELIDREQQDKNLRQNYEIEYLKWKNMPDRVHDLTYEEYKQKVLAREIDTGGREMVGFHPVHSLALYGAGASPFLEGFLMYVMGANAYHLDRQGFDEKHKLSETIDKCKDLWTNYDKPLYRGLSTNEEGLKKLTKGAKISMNGLSSWSSEKDLGEHFSKYSLIQKGNIPVIFVDKSKRHSKTMFYPFSSAMGFSFQYEYVQSGSKTYTVKDVRKQGEAYYAEVESD